MHMGANTPHACKKNSKEFFKKSKCILESKMIKYCICIKTRKVGAATRCARCIISVMYMARFDIDIIFGSYYMLGNAHDIREVVDIFTHVRYEISSIYVYTLVCMI
jgi:hypothetical protein